MYSREFIQIFFVRLQFIRSISLMISGYTYISYFNHNLFIFIIYQRVHMTVADFFDLRTFLLTVTFIQIFLWGMMLLYRKYHKMHPGFQLWAFHLLCIGLGNISMFLTGSLPGFLTVSITNVSTCLGFLFLYGAVSRFYQDRPINPYCYSILIPLWVGVLYFTEVLNSFAYRVDIISVALIIILIPIIHIFLTNTLPVGKRVSFLLGGLYLLLVLILALRAINFLVNPPTNNILEGSFFNILLFLYSLLFTIIATFLFFLLQFDRITYDLSTVYNRMNRLTTRYDLAVKAAGAGVWEMDISSGELIVDEQILRFSGTEPSKSNYESFDEETVIHHEDLPLILEKIKQITRENEEISEEYRVTLPDGEIRHHLTHARSIKGEGGKLRLIGLTTDITALRRVQNALEEALKKLSTLNSITRHDILNAVTVISLYSELLLEESIDPDENKKLEMIFTNSQVIASLINFTSEYQKLGIQKPLWLDLISILSNMKLSAKLQDIEFRIPTSGMYLFIDRLFEKVIYNLVENSIHHGETVQHISFSYEFENSTLLLVYADDGTGIADLDKEKIFKQGFGKNTGMGLFLCREILGITGISITEEGKEGEGVRFVMRIPAGLYRDERTSKD